VSRPVRALFGVVLVLASAAPLLRSAEHDSYPFSTYPMFARPLGKPQLTFAEGLTRSGHALRLPPEIVANDEPMQAMRTLKLTANQGPRALRQLCSGIAERAVVTPGFAHVQRVRISRARFEPLRYFEADAPAVEAEVLVECRVRRRR
jgi:hypothetical protein